MNPDAGKYPNKIVAFDYDGTLHPNVWPDHGAPFKHMRHLVDRLRVQGHRVMVHTSRWSIDAPEITGRTSITEVHTGKPVADLYLDDKGLLPREGIVDGYVEQHFETPATYLDKLTTGELLSRYARNIENVPENPAYRERHDENFRVFIPLTGGMDSTTLWQMALESGLPVVPVYIDMGQEYAAQEIELARELAAETGHVLTVFAERATKPVQRFDYILLARNAVVIYTIAEWARQRGWWGELWFGNLAGESPVLGGDKSRRFFNDTQALLDLRGHDLRIVNPLIGMDKPDEVAYWLNRDIDKLIRSKSCFSAESNACGECQTCFRKWVAFFTHDIDIRDTFTRTDVEVTFARFADKYRRVMGAAKAAGDHSHYSPSRIATTLDAIEALGDPT